ncbi:poly [ADP-ribose] polymerase 11-like, partial [Clarias magur]
MSADWGGEDDYTEPMDTSDYPWYWSYQAECGIWHRTEDDPVNPISSSELEMFYIKNPYGVISIKTAAGILKIDLHGLQKTNLSTGQTQKLKRSLFVERMIRCKCADQAPSVPAHWENMDSKAPFQAFTVSRQTNEFKEVERYVRDTGLLQEPLKYVYRIQNVDLWELYCRKKSQLMRIKGHSDIEERMLFHGTGKNNVPNICKYNFDCRISDSVRCGHLFGKGTYFALHASYADTYSQRQGHMWNDTRIMFLARDDPVNPISSSELEMLYVKNPCEVININTAAGILKIDFCGNVTSQIDPSAGCSVTSEQIEANYNRNQHGSMDFYTPKYSYRLDFSVMKQINVTTGKQRSIKRARHSATGFRFICDNLALPVPSNWERVNTDEPYQLIPLCRDTFGYNDVARLYERTMSQPIKSIQRIQNLDLWEFFCRKKAQLRKIKRTVDIDERMLFHGTGHHNIQAICTFNFDWRLTGSHGNVYGKGSYFARDAKYSSKFCHSTSNHNFTLQRHGLAPPIFQSDPPYKCMFLARVLVGEYTAFTVDRQTSEFKEVERYVRETGLLLQPLKYIYRIQNVDLWELYCRCKYADQAQSVPAHWEKMDAKTPYKAFTVDRQTSEFEEVERYVREIGLLREPLKYVYRIQNVDLWELYCRKKSQLMRIKGQSDIEERMLFHGTGKNYVDSICLYNFDCRIPETVKYGHLYGKGTYFSINASYADMYSRFRSQGHTNETRMMFLARVIVGNYRIGQQGFCKPD